MDEEFEIVYEDRNEPPIMLAVRAPGQVAAQPDPSGAVVRRGAVSGNKNFDPVTGRFAGKKLKPLKEGLEVVAETVQQGALPLQSGVPTGVDPAVWARRMAAVRDAGRQLEDLTFDTVRTFLASRVADVNQVDIAQFIADVQWQRIADLADVLDAKRKKGPVNLNAQARWIKKVFNNLDGPMAGHLLKILEGRGWGVDEIKKNIIKRVSNAELKGHLETLYGTSLPEGEKLPPEKKEGEQ
jgi:hypothetical protein